MKWVQKYRGVIVEVICFLFILLFVYAAVTKLWEGDKFHTTLLNAPIMGGKEVADLATWSIPLAELTVAVLLCSPKFRVVGLYGALGLLLVFTTYTVGILFFAPYRPCSCGGIISLLSWEQHLVLNIGCCLLAFTGIVLTNKHKNIEKKELSRYQWNQNS